jgi:hypothetical protein
MKYLDKMSTGTVFFFAYMLLGFVMPITLFSMKHDLFYVFFQLMIPVYYVLPGAEIVKNTQPVDWLFWETFLAGLMAAFFVAFEHFKRNSAPAESRS